MFKEWLRWLGLYRDGDSGGAGGAGGAGKAGGASGDGGDGKGNGDGSGKKPVTFTPEQQEEVNRLMGERAVRAGEAAVAKFLEGLGIKTAEELKATLGNAERLARAGKTEGERTASALRKMTADLAKANSERDAALETAKARLMKAAVLAEVAKPEYKVNPNATMDVWALIDPKTITMKEDGEFEGVGAAIKTVLKNRPYLTQTKRSATGTPLPAGVRDASDGDILDEATKNAAARRSASAF